MINKMAIDQLVLCKDDVINLLPKAMDSITIADAIYHGSTAENWIDLTQINTFRSLSFHDHILQSISRAIGDGGVILELGCGVGFDAHRYINRFIKFKYYIASEISIPLLRYAKLLVNDNENRIFFCALDSNELLIADKQIDAIFMIASLHHFTNLHSALSEINRVTKSSSVIAFGIEPNKLWSYILIVLRPYYRVFMQSKTHSAADEEAEGFSIGNFREIGRKYDWQIIDLKPVWFFAGFLHNGLEFIFRVFRLKKRIKVPIILEKVIVKCDDFLFKIPLMKYLAWHYSVIYKKR